MPKRGHRLPIRVEYTYPPSDRAPSGITGSKAHYDQADAETFARTLAGRGASSEIIDRDTGTVLATFEAEEATDV